MSCETYPGDVIVETPWAPDNWRCVNCGELVDAHLAFLTEMELVEPHDAGYRLAQPDQGVSGRAEGHSGVVVFR